MNIKWIKIVQQHWNNITIINDSEIILHDNAYDSNLKQSYDVKLTKLLNGYEENTNGYKVHYEKLSHFLGY